MKRSGDRKVQRSPFSAELISLIPPLSQENELLYGLCDAKLYPDLSHLEKRGGLTPVA